MPKLITPKIALEYACIGVDPGQKGGMSVIYPTGEVEHTVMPETELEVWEWFRRLSSKHCFAVLEKVHSMPQQSAQSGFTFGAGVGFIRGCLTASRTPFVDVTPQSWMKELGIPFRKKDEDKAAGKLKLLETAMNIFPSLPLWQDKSVGYKGRRLAVCDALLISFFCKMKYGGSNQ